MQEAQTTLDITLFTVCIFRSCHLLFHENSELQQQNGNWTRHFTAVAFCDFGLIKQQIHLECASWDSEVRFWGLSTEISKRVPMSPKMCMISAFLWLDLTFAAAGRLTVIQGRKGHLRRKNIANGRYYRKHTAAVCVITDGHTKRWLQLCIRWLFEILSCQMTQS